MKKLLLLLSIILLSSCASLDFQVRTLNTVGMYDGIYYNTHQVTPQLPNNFYFFQTPFANDFWWSYSLNNPYGYGLTYNWRFNRWSTNQFLYSPFQNQFRVYNQYRFTRQVVRNRGRRNTPNVTPPRTPIRTPQLRVPNQRIRTRSVNTPIRRNTSVRTPQRVTPSKVRQVPQRQVQRRVIQQTQPTRRTSSVVIKNKRNQ